MDYMIFVLFKSTVIHSLEYMHARLGDVVDAGICIFEGLSFLGKKKSLPGLHYGIHRNDNSFPEKVIFDGQKFITFVHCQHL